MVQDIRRDTPVTFTSDSEDQLEAEFSGMTAGPAVGIDEDISMEIMETTATPDILKVWPWVNQVCHALQPDIYKCIYTNLMPRLR